MTARLTYVVPAYNAEATLAETLDAILAQTVPDWRCIVVDDGSTDATLALARSYEERDDRFSAFTQENRGTAGAYNTGVRAATTEWIAICSADDIVLPEHLASILKAADRRPDIDIVSTNGYYERPDSRPTLVYGVPAEHEEEWSLADLFHACFYGVGAAYRKSVFDTIGGYREHIYAEDYDFWIRSFLAGARHLQLGAPLSYFRISDTQKSADRVFMYDGDIALIRGAMETGNLSEADFAAGEAAVTYRERLKAEERRRLRESGPLGRIAQFVTDKARGLIQRLRSIGRRSADG